MNDSNHHYHRLFGIMELARFVVPRKSPHQIRVCVKAARPSAFRLFADLLIAISLSLSRLFELRKHQRARDLTSSRNLLIMSQELLLTTC